MRHDTFQNRLAVDVGRQRQLHQNTVDGRIAVQFVHQFQQIVLRGFRRQLVRARFDAAFLTGQFFIAYINRAGRIVADQYHRQTRRVQTFFLTRLYRLRDRLDALLGDFFSVYKLSSHDFPSK